MTRVLSDFRCPLHGRDLAVIVEWDGDESGTWTVTTFACQETWPHHFYRAEPDGAGDYVPVDDEADD